MNKDKKIQIAKNTAKQILLSLNSKYCFDGFITRFFTRTKCINHIQKCITEYFSHGEIQLANWNKNTWLDIFDDEDLVDALVWYMQDFNLNKEVETENDIKSKRK